MRRRPQGHTAQLRGQRGHVGGASRDQDWQTRDDRYEGGMWRVDAGGLTGEDAAALRGASARPHLSDLRRQHATFLLQEQRLLPKRRPANLLVSNKESVKLFITVSSG